MHYKFHSFKNKSKVDELFRSCSQWNILDLTEKNNLVTSEKKKIEAKLVDQKDYMDIKRECEILKDTQFSGTEKTKLESQTLEGSVLDWKEIRYTL